MSPQPPGSFPPPGCRPLAETGHRGGATSGTARETECGRPQPAPPATGASEGLIRRTSGDGSFSLWCPRTGEAFHSADGALAEAQRVFVAPAELHRFLSGTRLRVVEVAVGTGTNTAALIQACTTLGLELDWWGLEREQAPLQLALADNGFRAQWAPRTLAELQRLVLSGRLLWGDARHHLPDLLETPPDPGSAGQGGPGRREPLAGRCDLVLLDAFSPQRCPALWSVEFLGRLGQLLAPGGRLLTYSSAAAIRHALELCGLQLAAIRSAPDAPDGHWSAGTVAGPDLRPEGFQLRALSAMEREHLASRAGEPYRDPSGKGSTEAILAERQRRQQSSDAEPSSAWQRRWGTARRHRAGGSEGGTATEAR
ncbi:MAG: MnmC family methyltransferase [Cyanobium sp.]